MSLVLINRNEKSYIRCTIQKMRSEPKKNKTIAEVSTKEESPITYNDKRKKGIEFTNR